MGNGEQKVRNEEWGLGNGKIKWKIENGEWRMGNDEWEMENRK